jgi:hypothetical protein
MMRGAQIERDPPPTWWSTSIRASAPPVACGLYRRHMKTMGYLSQIDKL